MNTALLLLALAMCETANKPKPSPAWPDGDPWQISIAVHQNRKGRTPQEDAKLQVAFLIRELRKEGYEPTVYQVALSWRSGLNAYLRDRTKPAHRVWAHDLVNTYEDLRANPAKTEGL